jgi:hypothetical protein
MRVLTFLFVKVPHPVSTISLFLGELVGVLVLQALRKRIAVQDGSVARERALALLDHILTDEVGHLAYNQARLSTGQLLTAKTLARVLFPLAAIREPLAADDLRGACGGFRWTAIPANIRQQAWLPALTGL